MSWPTPQDYAEAVQNPQSCFEDLVLKQATTVTNRLGLPRAVSGQFACVFRLKSTTGEWAVRCFLRETPDQQERYALIGAALNAASLSCIVSFRFVERGIRVRGKWYPVLVMRWIEGMLLNEYVKTNLSSPRKLLDLADQFLDLGKSLHHRGIAHGDLQHGNVVVVNGAPVLVDYDGMFVPALAGRKSHELGHRNYQHPQRREDLFDTNLDRFSLWIIYLALVALSEDSSLWDELDGGDDALIFRATDFREPYNSRAISALQSRANKRLAGIAVTLEHLCSKPVGRLPQLPRPGSSPAPVNNTKVASSTSVSVTKGANGSWIVDWIKTTASNTATRLNSGVERLWRSVRGFFYALVALIVTLILLVSYLDNNRRVTAEKEPDAASSEPTPVVTSPEAVPEAASSETAPDTASPEPASGTMPAATTDAPACTVTSRRAEYTSAQLLQIAVDVSNQGGPGALTVEIDVLSGGAIVERFTQPRSFEAGQTLTVAHRFNTMAYGSDITYSVTCAPE